MIKTIQKYPDHTTVLTFLITQLSKIFPGHIFRDELPPTDSHVTAVDLPMTVTLLTDDIINHVDESATNRLAIFHLNAYHRSEYPSPDLIQAYAGAAVNILKGLEGFCPGNKVIITVNEKNSRGIVLEGEDMVGIQKTIGVQYVQRLTSIQ